MRARRSTQPDPTQPVDLWSLLEGGERTVPDFGAAANDFVGSSTSIAPGTIVQTFDTSRVRGEVCYCTVTTELCVMVTSYAEAPTLALRAVGDGLLMLNLRLEGDAINESDDPAVDGRASLTYFTPGSSLRWWLPHGGPWRSITVFGTPNAFEARWGLGSALLEALGATPALIRRRGRLLRRPWTVTREALDILRTLLARRFEGALARAYIEARGEQFVCEFLAAGPLGATQQAVPARTRELVRKARSLLLEDAARPHTLLSLARRVGLNRTLLAQGFRAEFGETVFECLQRERLQRAWALLQGSQAKITAVALQVGYLDSASFARAFKAHFGVTPTQALRSTPMKQPHPDAR